MYSPILIPFVLLRFLEDIYGPFWICTTLIFALAASSNLESWWIFTASADRPNWIYDFKRVVTATSMIYGYNVAVPLGVWFAARYMNCPMDLIPVACLYGYSMLIMIPAVVSGIIW